MSQQKDQLDTEQEHGLATEAEEQAHLEDVVPEAVETPDDSNDSPEEQLLKAQGTIKEYWDQILRMRAEIENNRKRAERDLENAHKYALKGFMENLVPVIDSIEMGQLAAAADNATLESIREGTELTMNMFAQVLERSGLQQIDPLGEKFDPERHQAITMVETADAEANSVIEVMQKGFLLNDRLIRPAMVVVAK
ncbi:MAG TPA: nucleotide exchange factor GrpE [Gammaproteobacteria bacterium]|nr:nucleotide exchange factor GrpE [Gammaproteobacteria bacterium]